MWRCGVECEGRRDGGGGGSLGGDGGGARSVVSVQRENKSESTKINRGRERRKEEKMRKTNLLERGREHTNRDQIGRISTSRSTTSSNSQSETGSKLHKLVKISLYTVAQQKDRNIRYMVQLSLPDDVFVDCLVQLSRLDLVAIAKDSFSVLALFPVRDEINQRLVEAIHDMLYQQRQLLP
ncbi:hypothetical protein YC2023_056414 [Brassica napus]